MTTLSDTTGVKRQFAELAAHIRGLRAVVATIEGHLQGCETAILALMEHHSVSRSGEGLTTPEDRGS
jgi:hypothetical protein